MKKKISNNCADVPRRSIFYILNIHLTYIIYMLNIHFFTYLTYTFYILNIHLKAFFFCTAVQMSHGEEGSDPQAQDAILPITGGKGL